MESTTLVSNEAKEGVRPAAEENVPWARAPDKVAEELSVTIERGLSSSDVRSRLDTYGRNDLRRRKPRSTFSILVDQFRSIIVALLAVAAGVAYAFGEVLEAWAILVVILINAALGFVTELRAVRSMEALYALARTSVRVRRDGEVREIDASELVPGDVVIVEGGDVVAADMRLVSASRLQVDESTLTGESLPLTKSVDPVASDTPQADRTCMLFKGTAVTRGSGTAIVTQTGTRTELGKISELVAEAGDEGTPLEERLDVLGRKLIWVTLAIAAVVGGTGILRGKDLFLMIETAIALAVASIPEGLPIVATIALARGVRIMARRNALVNRLSSVETLGSAGVICTDKTGTLTENRMTVVRVTTAAGTVEMSGDGDSDDALRRTALELGMLCNNASIGQDGEATGDPMERALLQAGLAAGIDREALIAEFPRVDEEAFDAVVKMMATVHEAPEGYRIAVKGAPEAVIEAATSVSSSEGPRELDDSERQEWERRNEELAAEGLRVLAVAEKKAEEAGAAPYEGLTLVALLAMADPPRDDVADAIATCRRAGIQVVMVTGDQPVTARSIAHSIGLLGDDEDEVVRGADLPPLDDLDAAETTRLLAVRVFARVDPSQKLDLIELHQQAGHIVAMTGDGVNDAPALQKADIGIAMGQRGTQVAREAADMVLRDDAFSTIVTAVEQGRIIFGNIRRFVFYLLSCNVSEVMVIGLATLAGTILPLYPLQILFLNLVTDIFPALALGMGEGDPHVMKHHPRDPSEPVLKRRHWLGIAFYGVVMTAAVLGALLTAHQVLGLENEAAVTVSFLTLAFGQLWHVFNMRSRGSSVVRNEVVSNPYVWAAVVLCTALLVGATYVPAAAEVLRIQPPGPAGWMVIAGFSLLPLAAGQIALSRPRD